MNVRSVSYWLDFLFLYRRVRGRQISLQRRKSIRRLLAFHALQSELQRIRTSHMIFRRRKRRRWHVRPMFQMRKLMGAWYTIIPIMREEDPAEYFKFLRMTPESFDWLLGRVSPILRKQSIREPVGPGERLAVTLRYLASGDSMASLSYLFLISNQAISTIVFETTAAIWYSLREEVFEPLGEDFWRRKAAEFQSMCQFPMCVGAVDGKHCTVQKFAIRGSELYNYKNSHSLVLMAVTDAKYKFIAVDVGARGRENDAGVFEDSEFGQLFFTKRPQLPAPVYNEDLKSHLPYVFVGDDAFDLDVNFMKPFRFPKGPEEEIFNYRLSRARTVVENSFGIMAARFRIFRKPIIGSETLVQNIILCCAALHNMHLLREDSIPPKQRVYMPPGYADMFKSNGKIKEGRWRNESKQKEDSIFRKLCSVADEIVDDFSDEYEVRSKFIELFIIRSLPWQYDILPGQ